MKKLLLGFIALIALAIGGLMLWVELGPPDEVARSLIALERERVGFKAKELRIPGFRVAYLDSGGDGEPLVLVHGFGADKENWTRVAAYLTPHMRVVALDMPGFGASDKPLGDAYRSVDHVARLHAFIETLGLQSVHLGGNSMGGKIAIDYAARYPNDVKSLWLLAPAGVMSAQPSKMMQRVGRGEAMPLLPRSLDDYERLLDFVTVNPPYIPRPIKQVLSQRAAADYELHRRIFEETSKEWSALPVEQTARRVMTPTRIVWGKDDAVLHVSGAAILQRAMPNASTLLLDDIGHVPMIETPQTVAEDYLAFRKIDTKPAVVGP